MRSPRPRLSQGPDAREQEAAEQIKQRRQGIIDNDVGRNALKNLYEETFAVRPDYTLGGLISHHYRKGSDAWYLHFALGKDSHSLDDTAGEAIEKMKGFFDEGLLTRDEYRTLVETTMYTGVPVNTGSYGIRIPIPREKYETLFQTPRQLLEDDYFRDLFERGWLYLQGFTSFQHELESPSQDQNVIQAFQRARVLSVQDQPVEAKPWTKNDVLLYAWEVLSLLSFDQEGYFKPAGDSHIPQAITRLAALRGSPEFAFFYTHFSARGAIADKNASS